MSHHLPLHPSQLELVVSSKPLQDKSSTATTSRGRSWLVTVRTRLDAAYIDLTRSTSACQLIADTDDLVVSCLGQPDPYSAVYSVRETTGGAGNNDAPGSPKVRVRLTPRYHSATGTAFRLDDKLAALVGRSYLVHPKYALSVVLAYARAQGLDRERCIECDPRLESLLGCRWVKKQQLWTRLEALVGRFHTEAVSLEHILVSADSGSDVGLSTTAALAVACDRDANLFPADWNHVGTTEQRAIYKTRTASDYFAKSGSSGSSDPNNSSSSCRSGSRLKRHKTI